MLRCKLAGMDIQGVLILLVVPCIIAVGVWALFLLGDFLGVQWYVSAVAILLIGRYFTHILLSLVTS
jgi:hypothetical protein